ncbi:MAG: SCO family protein [Pseudomonadota bacterium]
MSRLASIGAIGALALLVGGTAVYVFLPRGDTDLFANCRAGQVAGGTDTIGGPFELVNGLGETVTDADVITGPTLIYFGYTFCPDVCPLDTARNAEAVEILDERGVGVTPVFISVDPARDTPEVVGAFAENFHDRMIGLTGSDAQVKAASQAYKTYYKAHEAEDDYYLVDHSTFTYFVLPEHGFVEFFRRGDGAEDMADRVACFVAEA